VTILALSKQKNIFFSETALPTAQIGASQFMRSAPFCFAASLLRSEAISGRTPLPGMPPAKETACAHPAGRSFGARPGKTFVLAESAQKFPSELCCFPLFFGRSAMYNKNKCSFRVCRKGEDRREAADRYRHRSQILFCLGGVCGARAGRAECPSGGGGRPPPPKTPSALGAGNVPSCGAWICWRALPPWPATGRSEGIRHELPSIRGHHRPAAPGFAAAPAHGATCNKTPLNRPAESARFPAAWGKTSGPRYSAVHFQRIPGGLSWTWPHLSTQL
jgi:hypothetical protein